MSYWLLYESNDDVLVSLKMSLAQQWVQIIFEGVILFWQTPHGTIFDYTFDNITVLFEVFLWVLFATC